MATTVETALGPIATTELGPTLMHEHIVTRSPGLQENWPHCTWGQGSYLGGQRLLSMGPCARIRKQAVE
jgi:predicted metal-dependent phosphotriesterase family hydrolase